MVALLVLVMVRLKVMTSPTVAVPPAGAMSVLLTSRMVAAASAGTITVTESVPIPVSDELARA